MFDNKVLTISVAAYNVESYLEKAVWSCVGIGDTRIELVIVNDGSTDGSLALARRLEAECPDVVRVIDKQNGGYGSTINASLAVARGRYYRYCDGDDWLMSDCLGEYLDVLDASHADAVYAPYLRCYEGNGATKLVDSIASIDGTIVPNDIPRGVALAGCSLAYRTDLMRDIGFRMSEHRYYADIEYAYLPMAHASTLQVTHIPVYGYRIGRSGQSVSVEGIARHYQDILVERKVLMENLTLNGSLSVRKETASYIEDCLVKEVVAAMRFACVARPTADVRRELREFDRMVSECPPIYRGAASRSKIVKMLRSSRFLLLPVAHQRVLRQMERGE